MPHMHESPLELVQCVPHGCMTGAAPGLRHGCLRVQSRAWSALHGLAMLVDVVSSAGSQSVGSPGIVVDEVNHMQSAVTLML